MADIILFVCMLAAAVALRLTVVELARVKGSSMQPTLRTGQWLLVSRLAYRLGQPRRGDVVICHYPGRYLDRWKRIRQSFVKRVIGLPGETIAIIEGVVHIDGQPLDEPYLDPMRNRFRRSMPERVLGPDEYFVLGDNRDSSNDSRRVGPLPRSMMVGRVCQVIFPFGHHDLTGIGR
ncbi:MAG: signal peptidase I [Aristaeellaceae bacterium]